MPSVIIISSETDILAVNSRRRAKVYLPRELVEEGVREDAVVMRAQQDPTQVEAGDT